MGIWRFSPGNTTDMDWRLQGIGAIPQPPQCLLRRLGIERFSSQFPPGACLPLQRAIVPSGPIPHTNAHLIVCGGVIVYAPRGYFV